MSRSRKLAIALLGLALITFSSKAPRPALADAQHPHRSDAAVVRIGVFGLFHSSQLKVSPVAGAALVIRGAKDDVVLETSSGGEWTTLETSSTGMLLLFGTRAVHISDASVTGRMGESADFVLTVPHKISRHYRGTLEITASGGELTAVVSTDIETAVASVVAAESATDTSIEALKAQAIAARSYFVASRGRHRDFDFCDTTHCQFLREPPPTGSLASKATETTRGLVLAYAAQPLAAMYSRSCGGRTRTPEELGLATNGYPYYPVECKYCRQHPERWTSKLSAQDANVLGQSSETARLSVNRRLGWSAVPSNNFKIRKQDPSGAAVFLEGRGEGHGIGLCQTGAKSMAEEGASFQEILNHYYPNTAVILWNGESGISASSRSASRALLSHDLLSHGSLNK